MGGVGGESDRWVENVSVTKKPVDDDWLREWNEVQDHRYDPGHWLGRIHPFYRHGAAAGTSVAFGIGLIAIGLLSAVGAFWRPPLDFRVGFGVLAVLFVLLGISNMRAAQRYRRRDNHHRA